MRKDLFVLATIGLVIVSASAGYLVGTFRTPSVTTTTTATAAPISLPSSVCATPVHHPNVTGTTNVYQIALESIGVICVRYEFAGNGSYSFNLTNYGPQVSSGSWMTCKAKNGNTVPSACSGVSITPSQPSINHLTSQNITVAYTISTETSVPRLFWFFITSCDAIPLAIGLDSASVSHPPGIGCISTLGAPTSVIVTRTWNINVTEVPIQAMGLGN